MASDPEKTGLQLRSAIGTDGRLTVSLVRVAVPEPADDEIVVRLEAAPINPSDLGLLFGPADMTTATTTGTGAGSVVEANVPAAALPAIAGRLGQSLPVGNEGAGTVIRAGASAPAQAALGKRVAMLGGAMYAQYRCLKLADCMVLPVGATAADGASSFVNPLTALGMVETLRAEGHTALIHTAAASNLGQILNRICLADGIGLVNVVRNPAQQALLRDMGATHVCDSTAPGFLDDLTAAIAATGATLAFDAIGGGRLAGQILGCMEAVLSRAAPVYNRYGSSVHKQVYLYGMLDPRPTEITRSFGMSWGVGGWLLFPFLQKAGPARVEGLRARVMAELQTTFASRYTREVSLVEALQPAAFTAYYRRGTGEKFIINPAKDLPA